MSKYGTMLPMLALAGVLTMLLGSEARAQTADDLVCNKCVQKRDIARNAVVRSRIKKNAVNGAKIKDGSVALKDLAPAVQQVIADLQAQVAALQALVELAAFITVDEVETDLNGDGAIDPASERLPRILIEGANVQIANGDASQTTDSLNGLGNLIVGYNEPRGDGFFVCSDGQFDDNDPNDGDPGCEDQGHVWALNHKSGSHNLVVGEANAYSQTGGVVFGTFNAVSRTGASVTGGTGNAAIGHASSVSGGFGNTAGGLRSSVSGGRLNTASGRSASVSGGLTNEANGDQSSISGGWVNRAEGEQSSVSGGSVNLADGDQSSVSGGEENSASGRFSSVSVGTGVNASTNAGWAAGTLSEP